MKKEVYTLKENAKENSFSKGSSRKEQILNDKVKYLEETLHKCVNGKEKLDAILGKQKYSLNKAGLGYNPFKRKTFSKSKTVHYPQTSSRRTIPP